MALTGRARHRGTRLPTRVSSGTALSRIPRAQSASILRLSAIETSSGASRLLPVAPPFALLSSSRADAGSFERPWIVARNSPALLLRAKRIPAGEARGDDVAQGTRLTDARVARGGPPGAETNAKRHDSMLLGVAEFARLTIVSRTSSTLPRRIQTLLRIARKARGSSGAPSAHPREISAPVSLSRARTVSCAPLPSASLVQTGTPDSASRWV